MDTYADYCNELRRLEALDSLTVADRAREGLRSAAYHLGVAATSPDPVKAFTDMMAALHEVELRIEILRGQRA